MEKVVLITGASTGIGHETAKLFQSKNWKVAATMRTPENADDLKQIVDVECIRLDVTDADSVKAGVQSALEKFGRIDAVVNNAGYGLVGPFEATGHEQIERQFQTNVFGTMHLCRAILPYFREQKRGIIVNVASLGGRITFPFYSVYNSTKWAVEGFSESLQFELEQFNIRIKIIEPGPIKTDFYGRSQDVAETDGLGAYKYLADRLIAFMQKSGETAPDGRIVAQTIYDAVTDNSKRLRYPVNTKGLLFLRRFLPESLYFPITKSIFLSKAK